MNKPRIPAGIPTSLARTAAPVVAPNPAQPYYLARRQMTRTRVAARPNAYAALTASNAYAARRAITRYRVSVQLDTYEAD